MAAPNTPPTPPKPGNTRRHARFELLASVEIHQGDETVILPARNLSLGGIYLGNDGHDLTRFAVGSRMEVLVFNGADESHPAVRASGEVVRHEEGGIALQWSSKATKEIKSLIMALRPASVPVDGD